MKKLLIISTLFVCCSVVNGQQNPAYRSFNTNHFETNGLVWPIGIKSNATIPTITVSSNVIVEQSVYVSNSIILKGNLLNPVALFIPTPSYDVFYDPFSAGFSAGGGTFGKLGWSQTSAGTGGAGLAVSNAPGHFGTLTVNVTSTANSIQSMWLSFAANNRPFIPPLNSKTGWTNTWVWRFNGTNSVKGYWGMIGNANYTQSALEQSIGIHINTTNNDQIMGHLSHASVVSTTNLGTLQDGVWYTNSIWCVSAGTILFNLNGGPPAALSANLTSSALTPSAGVVKTQAGVASSAEFDVFLLTNLR